MISTHVIDSLLTPFDAENIHRLSIRRLGKLVAQIEQQSGVEFIHMEMGVPGLPASPVGIAAEKAALDSGLASAYPNIEGIPFVKAEIARFVQLFLNIESSPERCIPTVGGMQGSFAALLAAARTNPSKPYTLFIDPGFPVQKSQLDLLGLPYKSFDFGDCRGEKLHDTLEAILKEGNVCSICYSSPNNPTWCCFSEEELRTIGTLANRYDAIVIEDLAYFGMDFREPYGVPAQPPFQPTAARYADHYLLILSASKIFSYAGQRIGMLVFSEKTYTRRYAPLQTYFPADTLGRFIPYGVLYATTAGTSHTAQYALACMLQAANDGKTDFVSALHPYGEKAKRLKAIFRKNGFHIVYHDPDGTLADGFYFTIAYPGMTSGELMKKLLYVGISAISLAITGSENPNGLRACVSSVRMDQMDALDERLQAFVAKNKHLRRD